METSFLILEPRLCCPDDLRLWRAADDVCEYRLRLSTVTGEYYADLAQAIQYVQEAARAAAKEDQAGILDSLKTAAKVTTDPDIVMDLYRLIYSLGFDCPAHGKETFLIEGKTRFDGRDVYEDVDHTYCSVCGDEIESSPILASETDAREITPLLF